MSCPLPRAVRQPVFVVLLLAVSFPTLVAQEKGLQLTFEGTMIADQGDPVATRKQFDMTLTVVPVPLTVIEKALSCRKEAG